MYVGMCRWMGGTCQNCYFLPATVQKSFHAFRLWLLHNSTQESHFMYAVMYTSNTVNKKKFVCLIIVYNGSLLTEGKSQN